MNPEDETGTVASHKWTKAHTVRDLTRNRPVVSYYMTIGATVMRQTGIESMTTTTA
jgi:hypothetical protein